MTKARFIAVVVFLSLIIGCSQSLPTDSVNAPGAAGVGIATALPIGAPSVAPGTGTNRSEARPPASAELAEIPAATSVSPSPDMGDLFAPPKVVTAPAPAPEPKPEPAPITEAPKKEEPLPPLRLIGFVEVDGLKALLSVNDDLTMTAPGDSFVGVQVIALDPPVITLKHGEKEFQIDLLEQPWFHQGSGGLASAPIPLPGHGKSVPPPPQSPRLPQLPGMNGAKIGGLALPGGVGGNPPSPPPVPKPRGKVGNPPGSPSTRGSKSGPGLPGVAGASFPPPPSK